MSRAEFNNQQGASTPINKHRVSTKLTHESLLTAWVDDAATIAKEYIPSQNATYHHTAIVDWHCLEAKCSSNRAEGTTAQCVTTSKNG